MHIQFRPPLIHFIAHLILVSDDPLQRILKVVDPHRLLQVSQLCTVIPDAVVRIRHLQKPVDLGLRLVDTVEQLLTLARQLPLPLFQQQ